MNDFPKEKFMGSLNLLHNGLDWLEEENINVVFGKFTDLNIWNKVLSPEVITHMSKSFNIETEPFLKWSDVKIDLLNFEEDYENEESLLSNVPENLFLFKKRTFYEGIRICRSVGGEIATPLENTRIETWTNISTLNNLGRIFLSYSDQIEENDFRNVYTGKIPVSV